MMYPFMTLPDDTEIVHSEAKIVDGKEQVKVYIETPIHLGFKNATCYLPEYRWEYIEGYTEEEMAKLVEIVTSTAHVIIRLAREGGVEGRVEAEPMSQAEVLSQHKTLTKELIEVEKQMAELPKGNKARSSLKKTIQSLSQEIEELNKTATLLNVRLRTLEQIKWCLEMDALPISARKKSLSFSNAMVALDGVELSSEVKKDLLAWSEGKKSFAEGYRKVLLKYNLPGGDLL